MRKILLSLLLVLLSVGLQAQQKKVVDRIIELGQTDNRTMHHLDVVTNRIGGRITGSNAYTNATEWVASQFRSWGMEVIVDEVGSVPVGFNRGPWFGRLLSDNGMILHFATPSYTAGTKGVQRGHVLIEPKSRMEFEQMKGALKGAWVLISGTSSGWPIDWSAQGDSIRMIAKKYNDSISVINRQIFFENMMNRDQPPKEIHPLKEEPALFYSEMVEAGILGVIQSARVPITVLYDRKNLDKLSFENLPTVCDIKLDEHQYAIIEQMAKERQYFQLEFDIRNHFRPGPVKFHNVIGVIKGRKYPNEYVMMGGHLDSFDAGTGGVDCGSGLSVTMEAARLIMASGAKPERTILACLWAAEEFGLWGSKHWVESNKDKLPRISNYFNRDGGPTPPVGITVPEAMYADFEKVCQPLEKMNPEIPFTLTKRTTPPRPRPTTPGSSDHAWFAINGVPTLSFEERDIKGYNFSYGEIWHTERDTYDKSIPEYQEHASVVTAVVVYGLASIDHILSREGLYAPEK